MELLKNLANKDERGYLCHPRCMALAAVVVWQMNALNNRPKEGRAQEALKEVCLPHRPVHLLQHQEEEEEEEEAQSVPHNPYGVFFLRDLSLESIPHLPEGREVDVNLLSRLIGEEFHKTQEKIRKTIPQALDPLPNPRRPRIPLVDLNLHLREEEEESSDEDDRLNLEDCGHRLAPPRQLVFPDDPDDYVPEMERGGLGLNAEAKMVWKQFLVDIPAKCAQGRGQMGTSLLPRWARRTPKEDFFKTLKLRKVFTVVRIELADQLAWENSFNNFFPPEAKYPPCRTSVYRKMPYVNKYVALATKVQGPTLEALRKRFRVLFDDFAWAPRNDKEKPWLSKRQLPGDLYPADSQAPSVGVRVNPRYHGYVTW